MPWGMDDGNGLVRLTVFSEYVPERTETWARVVAAAARGFMGPGTGRVTLPRFTAWGGEQLTRGIAEALLSMGG
ncbi:hypothetical protein [Streptomyces sp. NPDC017529]|uniref:hypothetical protein n=1 Tax=Streptomyces sp. NPDC017529 TaxID=3365000 RepID=UPI0037BD7595